MSRELDAAVAAAHQMTKEPKVIQAKSKPAVKKPAAKVPEKVGAPTVKVDKSGHRVRLRLLDHALEGCVSSDGGEQRFRLEPNKWTKVSDDVYTMLRDKFYKPHVQESPNWNASATNPERSVTRDEVQEYIIEFPDEDE